MLKIKVVEQGTVKEESIVTFEEAIKELPKYFAWRTDNEPEYIVPTFENVKNEEELQEALNEVNDLSYYAVEIEEVENMEITKYELRTASIETKKEYIYEGCTQTNGDICSEIIETFDDLDEALAALENYESSVYDLGHGKYEVTEYYVEVNDYEVIDGLEYIEPLSEAYFAKGDYHTERIELGDFGDYDLIKRDNDIYIEFHENVNRKNFTKNLSDSYVRWLLDLVDEYNDAETGDEQEQAVLDINNLLGI